MGWWNSIPPLIFTYTLTVEWVGTHTHTHTNKCNKNVLKLWHILRPWSSSTLTPKALLSCISHLLICDLSETDFYVDGFNQDLLFLHGYPTDLFVFSLTCAREQTQRPVSVKCFTTEPHSHPKSHTIKKRLRMSYKTFFKIYFIYFYVYKDLPELCLCITCVQNPRWAEKGVRCPGTGVTDGCELLCRC